MLKLAFRAASTMGSIWPPACRCGIGSFKNLPDRVFARFWWFAQGSLKAKEDKN
jgi:hypothetical protein